MDLPPADSGDITGDNIGEENRLHDENSQEEIMQDQNRGKHHISDGKHRRHSKRKKTSTPPSASYKLYRRAVSRALNQARRHPIITRSMTTMLTRSGAKYPNRGKHSLISGKARLTKTRTHKHVYNRLCRRGPQTSEQILRALNTIRRRTNGGASTSRACNGDSASNLNQTLSDHNEDIAIAYLNNSPNYFSLINLLDGGDYHTHSAHEQHSPKPNHSPQRHSPSSSGRSKTCSSSSSPTSSRRQSSPSPQLPDERLARFLASSSSPSYSYDSPNSSASSSTAVGPSHSSSPTKSTSRSSRSTDSLSWSPSTSSSKSNISHGSSYSSSPPVSPAHSFSRSSSPSRSSTPPNTSRSNNSKDSSNYNHRKGPSPSSSVKSSPNSSEYKSIPCRRIRTSIRSPSPSSSPASSKHKSAPIHILSSSTPSNSPRNEPSRSSPQASSFSSNSASISCFPSSPRNLPTWNNCSKDSPSPSHFPSLLRNLSTQNNHSEGLLPDPFISTSADFKPSSPRTLSLLDISTLRRSSQSPAFRSSTALSVARPTSPTHHSSPPPPCSYFRRYSPPRPTATHDFNRSLPSDYWAQALYPSFPRHPSWSSAAYSRSSTPTFSSNLNIPPAASPRASQIPRSPRFLTPMASLEPPHECSLAPGYGPQESLRSEKYYSLTNRSCSPHSDHIAPQSAHVTSLSREPSPCRQQLHVAFEPSTNSQCDQISTTGAAQNSHSNRRNNTPHPHYYLQQERLRRRSPSSSGNSRIGRIGGQSSLQEQTTSTRDTLGPAGVSQSSTNAQRTGSFLHEPTTSTDDPSRIRAPQEREDYGELRARILHSLLGSHDPDCENWDNEGSTLPSRRQLQNPSEIRSWGSSTESPCCSSRKRPRSPGSPSSRPHKMHRRF